MEYEKCISCGRDDIKSLNQHRRYCKAFKNGFVMGVAIGKRKDRDYENDLDHSGGTGTVGDEEEMFDSSGSTTTVRIQLVPFT